MKKKDEVKDVECAHQTAIKGYPMKLVGLCQSQHIAVFQCTVCYDYIVTDFELWEV